MEDSLGQGLRCLVDMLKSVLILVVMEDSLGHDYNEQYGKKMSS